MSKTDMAISECRTSSVSLLAETVAAGLHSLAQPLTAMQWHLEIAAMPGSSIDRQQHEMDGAQVALERVVAQLDVLRDVIRPFRKCTKYVPEQLREAIVLASQMQKEVLASDGVEVILRQGCADGTIAAPVGFVPRIMLCLFSLLRSVAPVAARFGIDELENDVELTILLDYPTEQTRPVPDIQTDAILRAYVEVLMGEFSTAPDLSRVRIVLPKCGTN